MFQILVDLDGVLVNMNEGFERITGVKTDPWPMPGEYWASKALGIPEEEIEAAMKSYDFWFELKPYPYSKKMMQWLVDVVGHKHVGIMTKPKMNKESWGAKFSWVEKHFPMFVDHLLIGAPKYYTANPESFLIDDCDENCAAFKEAKGNPILFAQPWNKRHKLSDRKFEILRKDLNSKLDFKFPKFVY